MEITDKIKSFEDACSHLGIGTELPEVANIDPDHKKSIIAFYKLSVIIGALNEGWKPDWSDSKQRKWFNWFFAYNYGGAAGLGCSYTAYAPSDAAASIGSRLCSKTEALAKYTVEKFKDLYEDYLLFN
jgi:hypothetical protein